MTSTTDPAPPSVAAPAAPAGMGPLRRTAREAGLALITLGVIVILFVGYQLFGTNITEANHQHALARQFSADVAQSRAGHQPAPAPNGSTDAPTVGAPGPAGPSAPPGGAVDHMVIPKIGLDVFVVEGTSEDDLRRGPGHYPGSPLPGQTGNSAIAGHRTTYGAPFFRLDEMAQGDPIYLTDLTGHTWVYKVSGAPVVVSPDDVSVLDPTPYAELTLTTCNPRYEATSRLVVVARLTTTPTTPATATTPTTPATTTPAPVTATTPTTPAPTTGTTPASATTPTTTAGAASGTSGRSTRTPASIAARTTLGGGRSSALAPTLLYGALVVLLWIGVRIWINRTRRWHRLAAYVIGIAVCLVPLWFCFENAVLLLPQSI